MAPKQKEKESLRLATAKCTFAAILKSSALPRDSKNVMSFRPSNQISALMWVGGLVTMGLPLFLCPQFGNQAIANVLNLLISHSFPFARTNCHVHGMNFIYIIAHSPLFSIKGKHRLIWWGQWMQWKSPDMKRKWLSKEVDRKEFHVLSSRIYLLWTRP